MNCYTGTLAELNYEWPMSQFHICSWHRYHLTTKKIPRVIVVTVEVRVGNLLLKSKVGFWSVQLPTVDNQRIELARIHSSDCFRF